MSKIDFDDNHYTIILKKGSIDIVFKIMFDEKFERFENRDLSTMLKYFISDALEIEYYSFLQILDAKFNFRYEYAVKQILRAFLREELKVRIDLPSDYYLLKRVLKEVENDFLVF